ncbi:hypothetical protein AAF712_011424 [Marasmius tenuissimus]|uniref:Uncharacterized protein n=1 Tax=Marasmius tenuissimus TaxID=585030 RepID=A0ABR2ZJL7_9AGAR
MQFKSLALIAAVLPAVWAGVVPRSVSDTDPASKVNVTRLIPSNSEGLSDKQISDLPTLGDLQGFSELIGRSDKEGVAARGIIDADVLLGYIEILKLVLLRTQQLVASIEETSPPPN